MKSISLLLGSGFSIPEGIKGVKEINSFIIELKDENFMISSDMTFILSDNSKVDGVNYHRDDELFFLRFIKWYTDNIDINFDYECFYDFFTSFRRQNENVEEINEFFKSFKSSLNIPDLSINGIHSYLSRFSDYFNQLLSILLHSNKYYDTNGFAYYDKYNNFIEYINRLLKDNYTVNIHTLNHDLFFEHISTKHIDLSTYFTDGFSEFNSQYFGEFRMNDKIFKKYLIRLKYFRNQFEKPLRLFKLHGSVDNYIADVSGHQLDLTRVKKDWKIGNILKENRQTETYTNLYQNSYPDIISGAKSKLHWYNEPFYSDLQNHFEENLKNAEKLIVVGYGFGDSGVNNKIEDLFLNTCRKMIIINPFDTSVDYSLFPNVEIIKKSIIDISLEEF